MTSRPRIVGGPAGPLGYRRLRPGPPDPRTLRTDLAPLPAALDDAEVLATVVHLSDLHVCDAQSPARVEFLDRFADPDSPIVDQVGEVGTYRPQELLTAQVLTAMVHAANGVDRGPAFGAAVDLAVITGDTVDNAQANELDWYLTALDGGSLVPDSGDRSRYEGVAADADPRYWHPEVPGADHPQRRHGFPAVPGLLDAVRAPVTSPGLRMPWLAVHGNHDLLLQGTVPASELLRRCAVGGRKPVGLGSVPDDRELLRLLAGLAACEPAALAALAGSDRVAVTADADRRIVARDEYAAAHDRPGARPVRHGFPADGRAYYRHDAATVTVLALDTVDEHGGWQGSLDREQFRWLGEQLREADADRRYVVLASHHSLDTLVNDTNAEGAEPRVLGPELAALLAAHPSVTLWLDGHTHTTRATPRDGYWELTAPSLIDWPQQGRVVELARLDGRLVVATTMLDHDGPAPWDGTTGDVRALAGLSRELAANDWQAGGVAPEELSRGGTARDRDLLLALPDPWAG